MKNIGFEHKGKYIDKNRIFPIYEHYFLSGGICEITISGTKKISPKLCETLDYPFMEIVFYFSRIFSKKNEPAYFRKILNIEEETKESIENLIHKVKENYKKEHY